MHITEGASISGVSSIYLLVSVMYIGAMVMSAKRKQLGAESATAV